MSLKLYRKAKFIPSLSRKDLGLAKYPCGTAINPYGMVKFPSGIYRKLYQLNSS
jgi:hypothetical protein